MQGVESGKTTLSTFHFPLATMPWRDRLPATPKIALVARHPETRMQAPWDDPEWQIWICAPAGSTGHAPRWDAALEIHDYPWETEDFHRQWLRQQTKPVFVNRLRGECPGELLFPRQELVDRFGSFFTSTVSWLLGLAISLETTREIALYGVEMEAESEYAYQRPSALWLIGIAQGRGIKITLPDSCRLMKAPLYPPN